MTANISDLAAYCIQPFASEKGALSAPRKAHRGSNIFIAMSAADERRTPGCGRSSCQRGSQSERYYNRTSPLLCSRITRFGKDLSYAAIRVRRRKAGSR
jgi:hypothetical protein